MSSKLIKGSDQVEGVVSFRDMMGDLDLSTAAEELAASDPLVRRLSAKVAEQARAEGLELGYREGLARVRTEFEEEKRRLASAVEAVMAKIRSSRAEVLAQAQDEVGDLVLEVARKILKDEVKWNREVVMGIVKDALRRVIDKDNVRIRVNVEDLPTVKEARADLLSTIDGIKDLEVIDDRRVGLGGAIVETDSGTIDARIETQLEEIKRAFSVR